ncbi:malate--CoA ligase subunit beta [methanotrophic endosymbiont of Bathymodiolus puteoserpentis (Logatchev)]|jgi:malate-CoA ligase subunit beta|uniref:malate--CoA ligase subunit beta n=1 Tax=methanotrophic endosymbiont of Bathymodiolus puteoserpentis (Logatchev) TaxID=343235 RepID=UPI0013C8B239|nr:malate--CoA ligase subunit beta [methanotrophic endosymbiont of Bathymodiolus puteoserpentis (Logatchev)]SHE20394.1 Succinyl-CoA ligase [ADP-forming] beta chain [methanotrophic endosymbiont of Bathymodiolus puteoserpentis (Logatchev)]
MDIHEYQAKEILAGYGVKIAEGGLAYSPEDAVLRAREIGGNVWAVKAQIHSGARGKAGGVKICSTLEEVELAAEAMLGKRMVTHQTGPAGKVCLRLYVEAGTDIAKELYFSFLVDRSHERIVMVGSAQGGMEIEDLAENNPDAIKKIYIDPAVGLLDFQAREMAFALGLDATQISHAVRLISGCYRAVRDLDANMLEINPLVVTKGGELVTLDAKMGFDDNALFRRQKIAELRDKTQEDSREMAAADRGLSYVGLDGDIGCMINGAGLAMATMDMIKLAGGEPANFLDVGGGASPERTEKAFRLVLADEGVKAMLVNIFAGINRCDWIAEGVVHAVRKIDMKIPLIVRLSGTNVEQGRKIIADSGLPIITATTLAEAAEKAVLARNEQVAKEGAA